MRLTFYLLTILVSLGCSPGLDKDHPLYTDAKNIKTADHIRIRGTKLFAILPDSFQYNEQSKSFTTGKQSIKFLKLPNVSWDEVSEKRALTNIPLYGYEGNFLETENLEAKLIDMLVQFGGEDFVFHITARTSTALKNGRADLLKILQSLYYDEAYELDELELANFTFDKTFTDYNLLVGVNDLFFYTKKQKANRAPSNIISFQMLSLEISEETLNNKVMNILSSELKSGVKFKEREIRNENIGTYNARILESEINFQESSGLYCLAVISDNENTIAITAKGYDDIEELKSHFHASIESLRFKN